jgi:hypothetical protein
MAKTPVTYEPEAEYRVQLSKVVELFGRKLLPRDELVIAGSALNLIVKEHGADVVESAERV